MRLAVVVLALCVSFEARAAPKRRVATTVHKPPAAAVLPAKPATKPTMPSPFQRVTPLPLRVMN
jgi:hypothetical protein